MKAFGSIVLAGVLTVATAGGALAQTVLNLGHSTPDGSHYSAGAKHFAERLEELSGGAFTVREHAASALGGERDMIEGLQIGSVELVITSTGPLGNFVPEVLVLDLPFLFRDYASARAILDGEIGDELMQAIDRQNLVALAWTENGFRHLTNSRRPIETPADLEGLKIRTMENPVHMAAFEAAGAAPTPMAFPEVFTALQQQVVDGQENPMPVITSSKFWEVQKYMTLTGHVYSPAAFLASPILWEGLSDEEKSWFRTAAEESVQVTRDRVNADEDEGVAVMRDHGVEVITEVDAEAFREAVAPAYDVYVSEHGDEMLKRIQAAQAE